MLNVYVLGSCRVIKPFKQLMLNKRVLNSNDNSYWYTHSTKDTIQKIKILRDQVRLSSEQTSMVVRNGKFYPDKHSSEYFSNFDAYIIEISSIEENFYKGVYCQKVAFNEYLSGLTKQEKDDIKKLKKIQTKQEIIRDLEDIYNLLGCKPILFVTHFLVPDKKGFVPEARKVILDSVFTFAKTHPNIAVYDPTPDLLEFGVDSALEDPLHYTDFYESNVLPDKIISSLEKVV